MRIHPDDVAVVSDAIALAISEQVAIAAVLRFGNPSTSWHTVQAVFETVGEEATPEDNVIELRHNLAAAVGEVHAKNFATSMAGIANNSLMPQFENLTSRQWDIVTRLVRGQRVNGIAKGLYLSPSTVRNHLAKVYRLVGVNSQEELIELMVQLPHERSLHTE